MRRLLAIAAVLAALGCQNAPSSPAPAAAPPAALQVQDDAGGKGPYRMGAVQRLLVDTSFPAVQGSHAVRIDVVRPDGGLYGTLRGKVEAGADGTATLRQALEVAGSSIEQYHMVGTWTFALAVDEGPPLVSASVVIGE
jgi:hypothetical protein